MKSKLKIIAEQKAEIETKLADFRSQVDGNSIFIKIIETLDIQLDNLESQLGKSFQYFTCD